MLPPCWTIKLTEKSNQAYQHSLDASTRCFLSRRRQLAHTCASPSVQPCCLSNHNEHQVGLANLPTPLRNTHMVDWQTVEPPASRGRRKCLERAWHASMPSCSAPALSAPRLRCISPSAGLRSRSSIAAHPAKRPLTAMPA